MYYEMKDKDGWCVIFQRVGHEAIHICRAVSDLVAYETAMILNDLRKDE